MKQKSVLLIFSGALLLAFAYGTFFLLPLFIERLGESQEVTGFLLGVMGVGTISAVVISKFLLHKIKSNLVAVIGSISYTIGIALFIFCVHSIGFAIILASLLLGFGWGFYYNAAPYSLSLLATNDNRSVFFSYLSAFNVLGSGVAPIIPYFLGHDSINFTYLFYSAGLASLLATGCFYWANLEFKESSNNEVHWNTFSAIMKSTAWYPLIMVGLGACAFTIMMNFQSTYASSIGVNYTYFYFIYSLSVVLSRLLLGRYLAQYNQYQVLVYLLIVMVISLSSFGFLNNNPWLYCMSSALFGVSYGLVYPIIQAIAVNVSNPKHQKDVMTFFSLSYFLGVYAFPPVAGLFIVMFGYTSVIIAIAVLAFVELLLALLLFKIVRVK